MRPELTTHFTFLSQSHRVFTPSRGHGECAKRHEFPSNSRLRRKIAPHVGANQKLHTKSQGSDHRCCQSPAQEGWTACKGLTRSRRSMMGTTETTTCWLQGEVVSSRSGENTSYILHVAVHTSAMLLCRLVSVLLDPRFRSVPPMGPLGGVERTTCVGPLCTFEPGISLSCHLHTHGSADQLTEEPKQIPKCSRLETPSCGRSGSEPTWAPTELCPHASGTHVV